VVSKSGRTGPHGRAAQPRRRLFPRPGCPTGRCRGDKVVPQGGREGTRGVIAQSRLRLFHGPGRAGRQCGSGVVVSQGRGTGIGARAVQSRIPVLSGIRRTAGRCPRLRLVERSGRTRIRARWRVKGFDIAAAIDRRESRGAALDRENSQRTSACPMTRFSGRPESARRIALSRGTQTRVKLFCAAL